MINIGKVTIAFTLGLGLGVVCPPFIERLKKYFRNIQQVLTNKPKSSNVNIPPEENGNDSTVCNGFSLDAINSIFSEYGVRLTNSGSFYLLMQKIESCCYKKLLKTFADKVTSSEILVDMLRKELNSKLEEVNISDSNQPPYIEETKLDEYIAKESALSKDFGTADQKVKFLLSRSYEHGIERFKNVLGAYLTEILEASEKGEDIDDLYREIMKLVQSHYEYVS